MPPIFGDEATGSIIMQAAQGILANQRAAQQLQLQQQQFQLQLKSQVEAQKARDQELDFRKRTLDLRQEEIDLRRGLDDLRRQKLEADIELTRARTAGLAAGGGGEPITPSEVRQRRLNARSGVVTRKLNDAWQRFVSERGAPSTFRVENGRRVEVPGIGPAALTFEDPSDLTDLMLKLQDDARVDDDTAILMTMVAQGEIEDPVTRQTVREQQLSIQRTQATIQALQEFQDLPGVKALIRGDGISEDEVLQELQTRFGPMAAEAARAETAGAEAPVPTVTRSEFFEGLPEPQVNRAMSLMAEGSFEAMARIMRGLTADMNPRGRYDQLSRLRVIMETERPQDGRQLFTKLFGHLGGTTFINNAGDLESPQQEP